MSDCFFCNHPGGDILYNCQLYRIILVNDQDYPGYLRVVLNRHLKELSDLENADNIEIYKAVIKAEQILRKIFNPDKINLASFGNMTPHVHWHIIPRFISDKHFPNPTWGEITNHGYQPSSELIQLNAKLKSSFLSLFIA